MNSISMSLSNNWSYLMKEYKMTNKWREIWNKKNLKSDKDFTLQDLIIADGFDTGIGSYDEKKWGQLVLDFLVRSKLKKNTNILEIGCGSGAFLYALNNMIPCNFYGIDYSNSMIAMAQKVLPHASFSATEANAMVFNNVEFDIIFSHSVFHYFPDQAYARKVLDTWCRRLKRGGKLVLLDLNDKAHENSYYAKRMLNYRNPETYKADYDGLDHLFFDKIELTHLLSQHEMGEVCFFPHAVSEYGNSEFRFNLMCVKN